MPRAQFAPAPPGTASHPALPRLGSRRYRTAAGAVDSWDLGTAVDARHVGTMAAEGAEVADASLLRVDAYGSTSVAGADTRDDGKAWVAPLVDTARARDTYPASLRDSDLETSTVTAGKAPPVPPLSPRSEHHIGARVLVIGHANDKTPIAIGA